VADNRAITRIDLNTEIARFSPDVPSGRRAETLLKTPRLRVVLVTMRAGAELREHTAPGPITIQPLRGRFLLLHDGDEIELATDSLVALEGGARHAVRALADGAFLLTIAWAGDQRDA
jgi:quercetin dioxygenase-like cupin family protein